MRYLVLLVISCRVVASVSGQQHNAENHVTPQEFKVGFMGFLETIHADMLRLGFTSRDQDVVQSTLFEARALARRSETTESSGDFRRLASSDDKADGRRLTADWRQFELDAEDLFRSVSTEKSDRLVIGYQASHGPAFMYHPPMADELSLAERTRVSIRGLRFQLQQDIARFSRPFQERDFDGDPRELISRSNERYTREALAMLSEMQLRRYIKLTRGLDTDPDLLPFVRKDRSREFWNSLPVVQELLQRKKAKPLGLGF